MRSTRFLAVLAGAAVVVALFVVLRPDDDDAVSAQPTTTQQPATATPSVTVDTTTTGNETRTQPTPKRRLRTATIAVTVRGGKILGGLKRATVARGRRVAVVVRADVADHVHVHGYDLFADVKPGAPARIAFQATVPGGFEIELEDVASRSRRSR